MQLSEFKISKAKSRNKPYKLADGGGLFLLVKPNGSKLWQQKYRHLGKERLLSHGQYPDVTLAQARQKLHDARALLAEGNDPATMKKKCWFLLDLASPLHNRPINEITSAELLYLLKSIEKSGRRETAKKMRGAISAVFRLAIVTLRAENDPTLPLRDALIPPKVVGRAAITDEKKFGALLRDMEAYTGWRIVIDALKFQILTMTRPGEVRGAKKQEIGLEKRTWSIPAERMKMRREHVIPLSDQALEIVKGNWPEIEGVELLFPSLISNRKWLSDNAFNSALRRMGYQKEEVTAHGFRVTASTILNTRGYEPDVIEAALAHQDKNVIRRTYNRASYWDQRAKLMQDWAELVDGFRADLS